MGSGDTCVAWVCVDSLHSASSLLDGWAARPIKICDLLGIITSFQWNFGLKKSHDMPEIGHHWTTVLKKLHTSMVIYRNTNWWYKLGQDSSQVPSFTTEKGSLTRRKVKVFEAAAIWSNQGPNSQHAVAQKNDQFLMIKNNLNLFFPYVPRKRIACVQLSNNDEPR